MALFARKRSVTSSPQGPRGGKFDTNIFTEISTEVVNMINNYPNGLGGLYSGSGVIPNDTTGATAPTTFQAAINFGDNVFGTAVKGVGMAGTTVATGNKSFIMAGDSTLYTGTPESVIMITADSAEDNSAAAFTTLVPGTGPAHFVVVESLDGSDAGYLHSAESASGNPFMRMDAITDTGIATIQFTAEKTNAAGTALVELTVKDELANEYDLKVDLAGVNIGADGAAATTITIPFDIRSTTYADDTAAGVGLVPAGTVYLRTTGELAVKL